MRTISRRTTGLLSILFAAGPAWGQVFDLTETPREGDCFRLASETNLSGTLKVARDGKPASIRIGAKNEHAFAERILTVEKRVARNAARHYATAVSRATVDGNPVVRALPADRRQIVAQRNPDGLFCYSPAGPLTRPDLEVVSEHFETLHLPGVLPGRAVRVGESWKLDSTTAQSLCLFDGLISHELNAQLKDVSGQLASISIDGTARGIENGALAALTVAATVRFDLTQKRIVAVEWKQKDVREAGPATPAAEVETVTVLKREPLAKEPAELAAAAFPKAADPPLLVKQLLQRDAKGRYQFLHARDWHVVGQTDHHLVLRLLERGDFVAQVTLTPWQNAGRGKQMAAEEFEQLTSTGTGWKPEQVLDRQQVPTDADRRVYRLTVRGTLDGNPVVQSFYLLATATGDQMILTFTMPPASAPRLGTRDLELVNAIEFARK
ncbi:MAG TPA: hypothetical protein VKD90_28960 [Gemmataceae bacterium]|nr:hypothetical protein [Gemmataceae bacterium]